MSHHVDRFGAALSVLAGHGHIKQRLVQAFEENLAPIEEASMPAQLKGSFAELRQTMTQVAPLNGEGRIRASVRKMSIHEACDCAKQIVGLYGDMIRLAEVKQSPLPLSGENGVAVPAALLKSV